MAYCENFRDDMLKINDDRKIKFSLSELEDSEDPNTCVFLMVRVNNAQFSQPRHYAQAWFRL